jgi:hypothetical protein
MTMRGWVVSGVVAVGLVEREEGAAPSRLGPVALVGAWTIAKAGILVAKP